MKWWNYTEDHRESNIKNFQICFYDSEHNYDCFDESFIEPHNFNYKDLCFIRDGLDTDTSKLFMDMKDGKKYQILIKEVND